VDLESGRSQRGTGIPAPRDLAVDAAAGRLYVTAVTAGRVEALTVPGGGTLWKADLGGWPAALDLGTGPEG